MQLLLSWICRWNTWGHFISAYENIGSTCKSHSKDEKPQRKIYISLVPLELYVGHKLWSQTINLHLRTNLKVLNICVWIHHSSEKSNSMWKDTNPAHFIGHLSHLCFHFFTGRLNNLWISLRGLWAKEKAGSGTLTKWWWPRLGTAFTLSCFVFVCAFSLCNFQSLSFFFFFIISRNGSSSRGILRISEQPVSPGRGRLKRWKVSFVVGFSSWTATPSGQTLKNLLKRSQVTLGHLWHLTLSSCAGCTAWTWSSSASLLDWWSSLRWNDVFMFSNKIWMSVKVRNEHKSGQQMSKTKLKDSRTNKKKKCCVLAGSDGSSLRFHSQEDCPQSRAGHSSGLLCPHGLQCESHIWQRPLLCHAFEYALSDFSANVFNWYYKKSLLNHYGVYNTVQFRFSFHYGGFWHLNNDIQHIWEFALFYEGNPTFLLIRPSFSLMILCCSKVSWPKWQHNRVAQVSTDTNTWWVRRWG